MNEQRNDLSPREPGARTFLGKIADLFRQDGDGRSIAIARTLDEYGNLFGELTPAKAVASGFSTIAHMYSGRSEDPAMNARGKTVAEIVAKMGENDVRLARMTAEIDLPLRAWDRLVIGLESWRDSAPEHEKARYEAMLKTASLEREYIYEQGGVFPVPEPRRFGSFTPPTAPAKPSPAAFD